MRSTIKMDHCLRCGGRRFERIIKALQQVADERRFEAEVPAQRCRRCQTEFFSPTDGDRFQLAVALRLADLGASSGAALGFMRKALGLDAADIAELFDVEPVAVERWEGGGLPAPRCMFIALAAVIQDKLLGRHGTLDRFRAQQRPARRLRAAIHVELFEAPRRAAAEKRP